MSTHTSSALHGDADDPELSRYMQIYRLQQLVSELLIKNEQLRVELFARQQRNGSTPLGDADMNMQTEQARFIHL
jgi:hypothetical protein